jgi:hypothetical protein
MQEFDKVKRTLEEYFSIKLDHRDVSIKGWNWGKATIDSEFMIGFVNYIAPRLTSRQRPRL